MKYKRKLKKKFDVDDHSGKDNVEVVIIVVMIMLIVLMMIIVPMLVIAI